MPGWTWSLRKVLKEVDIQVTWIVIWEIEEDHGGSSIYQDSSPYMYSVEVLEVKVRCSISESLPKSVGRHTIRWHRHHVLDPTGLAGAMLWAESTRWASHWQHFIVDSTYFTWFTLHTLWNLEDRKLVSRIAALVNVVFLFVVWIISGAHHWTPVSPFWGDSWVQINDSQLASPRLVSEWGKESLEEIGASRSLGT